MNRFRLRHALPLLVLLAFAPDVDAQRGRSSSSSSSSARSSSSSSVRSSSSSSRSSYRAPSVTRSSSTSSRPSTRWSGRSTTRSTTRSTGTTSRGSYVAPTTSRGSTRYLSPTRDTGRTPGSTYTPIGSGSSRYADRAYDRSSDSSGSYDGYRGATGTYGDDPGGRTPTFGGNLSGSSLDAPADAGGTTDLGPSTSYRRPTFPRAYRPTRSYAPSTSYTPRAYRPTPSRTAPAPRATTPTSVSDIADRYRGLSGRGSRSTPVDRSTDVLTDIARGGGADALRPDAAPAGTTTYGRGPLRRLAPPRDGSDGTRSGAGAVATPPTTGNLQGGRQRGTGGATGSGRNTGGGTIAGNATLGNPRVAGGNVAPTGGSGSGGYVTPGGGSTGAVPTVVTSHWTYNVPYYWKSYSYFCPPSYYWGWYTWCWPSLSLYWYYPYFYPRTTVVNVYQDAPVVYRDAPVGEGAVVYEGVANAPTADQGSDPLERAGLTTAAERYLNLGDRAFREGRFGDAVHFYAKAVEFSPDEGVLYLVLSDALFATGDYHYAAFAVRKALELDPTLVDPGVDKHDFYSDPAEFDRQLGVAELYVIDHPADADTRLVLALNYLLGGRPTDTVRLLENGFAESLRSDPAAALILEAARRAR